jgi:hypothetical protein
VPQTHEPAAEAEVDFHDLWVLLRGVKTKTALFTMRLSCSARAAHRASLSQGQEAFLEGHVYAFDRLGGVPTDKIRYDNLKPAVSRVLFGRTRVETQRWVAFRSTYGFDAFYCQPGHEGSHEKGGVEGEGGRFRRNHCVPMPRVDSIAELNALLEACDDADDARRVGNRATNVGQNWAIERPLLRPLLRPLPDEPFDTTLTLTPRVDRYAQVMVRCCQYSVPARFIGHRVRVKLSSTTVRVFDRDILVAEHERAVGKGVQVLELDHYLEILLRKPGALPGATALVQARAAGVFTAVHEAFWAAARKELGDPAGTRALIEVLLLHRHLDRHAVLAGITAALSVGSTSADVVAVEARKVAQQHGAAEPEADTPRRAERVVSLTERRLARCPRMTGRCRQWITMTSCWLEDRRDRPPRGHRAGRDRGDRTGLSDAAAAHHPGPVRRDRSRIRAGAAVLLGFPGRAGDGRVRRPGPSPRRTTRARGRLPAAQAAVGVPVRREPGDQPRGDRTAGHLRLGQGRTPTLLDRRLGHRDDAPTDRVGHPGRRVRLPGPTSNPAVGSPLPISPERPNRNRLPPRPSVPPLPRPTHSPQTKRLAHGYGPGSCAPSSTPTRPSGPAKSRPQPRSARSSAAAPGPSATRWPR